MLLAKILKNSSEEQKAQQGLLPFYRLGDLFSPLNRGVLFDTSSLDLYGKNRQGLAPYVFPTKDNGNEEARTLAFFLCDDLLRRLALCDFYLINSRKDAAYVERIAEGRKIAVISTDDDKPLGNNLFGSELHPGCRLNDFDPRQIIASAPSLVSLAARLTSLSPEHPIDALSDTVLSLVPLFYSDEEPRNNEPQIFRAIFDLGENARWSWSYHNSPCIIELNPSRQLLKRFLELDARMIFDNGAAVPLFNKNTDIDELEMRVAPHEVYLASATIEVLQSKAHLFAHRRPKDRASASPDCRTENRHPQSPVLDSGLWVKSMTSALRLPGPGFYEESLLKRRAADQKSKAELAMFDYSSGGPRPKLHTAVSSPARDISELRGAFGNLLKSMNVYCKSFQPYRVSMHPYHASVTDCIGFYGPLRLFRFRPSLESEMGERNLQDTIQNRLYLARAASFNDPNDSFPLLNHETIKKYIERDITEDNMLRTLQFDSPQLMRRCPTFRDQPLEALASHIVQNIRDEKAEFVPRICSEIDSNLERFRSRLRCTCFCEDIDSPNMWGLYAQDERGFALEYELNPHELGCFCASNPEESKLAVLAPIQYEERPDLSWLAHVLGGSTFPSEYLEGTAYLYLLDSAFKKTIHWDREKEWRVAYLADEDIEEPVYLRAKVKSIFLGRRMSEKDKRTFVKAAEALGVPLYEMDRDDNPTGCLTYRATWRPSKA